MRIRYLLFMGGVAALLMALVGCRPAGTGTAAVGRAAPDFTLTDMTGASATLSDYRGTVVVLDFWATWCPPCRASLPHTQAMSASADAKSGKLVVLAVNAAEEDTTVSQFLRANGYTFRTLRDTKGEVMNQYGVSGIPTFVVIDRDGTIAWMQSGYDEAGLTKAVAEALKR